MAGIGIAKNQNKIDPMSSRFATACDRFRRFAAELRLFIPLFL